jgi:ribonuclease HII
VAAASVVAKVERDRIMTEYDRVYPQYGFAVHKGYAVPEHRRAIATYGPSPIHRLTFRTVVPRSTPDAGVVA